MPPFAYLLMNSLVAAQMIQIGPPNPYACDALWAHPNLTLPEATSLSGRLDDSSGAAFPNTVIELHVFLDPARQPTTLKTTTDAQGHFHLGLAPAGRYRLTVPSAKGFLQPKQLSCALQGDCSLKITLQPASTDTLESTCPIR